MMTELDASALLHLTCDAALQILHTRIAAIAIVGDGGTVDDFAAAGLDGATLGDLRRANERDDHPARAVFEGRKAVRGVNPGGDPAAIHLPASHPPVHSYLFVPVASPSRTYGWLGLVDKRGSPAFSDEDVELGSTLGVLTGVTYENARRAAQLQGDVDQLRTHQELTEFAMSIARTGVSYRDLNSAWYEVSPSVAELHGWPPGNRRVALEDLLNAIHPDDASSIRARADKAIAQRSNFTLEFRVVTGDDRVRWVQLGGGVFSGEQGRPSRVVTAFADITERKRVEERLRDSEERHRRLFESIDQGFCTIEVLFDDNTPVDYRFLMVNPAFARQTGIFEATGRRMRDISPTHEEEWYQRFGQVAVTGESMRVEGLYSPRQRYFEVLAWKIGDPVERTIAVLFNDITGRREEQELMRRSEERWNAALEQLVEGVVIATQSGDVIYRNSATRRIYGFASADEGVGPLKEAARKFQLWTLDGGRPLTLDEWPIARIVRGETVRDVELRVRRTDEDRERVVSYSGAMSDTVGGERLIYLSVYDLTDQRKAEEAARRSAQQLQDVINGSPGLIFIKDLDGRYITINATYERFLGLRTDEVRGKTVYDLFPRDQAELLRENDRRVAETGAPLQAEESFDLPDGTHVFLSNKFPLHDTGGNVYAVCGISTDITERKKSDERLRQLQKLDSIGVLAGGIAHDFNNLLTGVIGNASLIQETLAADHAAAPLVHRIIQTGEQLAHLTRQLLAYAGKGRFVLEPLDVSALAREMTELLRLSIPNEVTLHFDLATDLPAIKADRGQAQQILMNLVINAGEAIGDHDGLVTVRTQLRTVDDGFVRTHPEAAGLSPGKYVVLQVRDTGCGMDTAVKAKLFDPFFSTKFTGRGLGLAAVSGIVRGHGGAIIVSSHPGKGSIFDVLLPAMVLPATTQPEAAPVVADRGVVFVIDDELIVRQLARMALERKGYAVLEADEGLTALGIFKQYLGTIDLVILDLSMPGMSGEEILPELRKIRPDVKVLISSGYGDSNAMTVFQGQQVSGFLQKPYTVAGLAEMVKRALS